MRILPTAWRQSLYCRAHLFTILVVLLPAFYSPAVAQLPPGFFQRKLTGDVINEATAMVHAPDGRIFIAERSGAVKVFQNGTVSTVYTVATVTAAEQGLLGITLHPDFATNGKCLPVLYKGRYDGALPGCDRYNARQPGKLRYTCYGIRSHSQWFS